MVSYEVDSHDVNVNNDYRDMAITMSSQALSLTAQSTIVQNKTSSSDIDSLQTTLPARVQEGGDYSYSSSLQNRNPITVTSEYN